MSMNMTVNNTSTATLSIFTAITILVGFGMFMMKNTVQDLERELAAVNASIDKDVKDIHILKAEWSRFNSPERLRALGGKYAGLDKVRAEQIINYSALPFEHEDGGEAERRIAARKNLSSYAERNRGAKTLAKSQR